MLTKILFNVWWFRTSHCNRHLNLVSFNQTGEISSASACFNKATKIDIQCPQRTMLRIHRVFFGYSPENHCSYSPGDCTYTEHENYPCVGKERCSINLPSGGFGRKIPSCKQESNYFQVDYECVPGKTKTRHIQKKPYLSAHLHVIKTLCKLYRLFK